MRGWTRIHKSSNASFSLLHSSFLRTLFPLRPRHEPPLPRCLTTIGEYLANAKCILWDADTGDLLFVLRCSPDKKSTVTLTPVGKLAEVNDKESQRDASWKSLGHAHWISNEISNLRGSRLYFPDPLEKWPNSAESQVVTPNLKCLLSKNDHDLRCCLLLPNKRTQD